MITITDKANCCGCTACMNICPKGAIEMIPDEEGFLYPKVNAAKCIACGLCERVCPTQNQLKIKSMKRLSVALRTRDESVLKQSTSGGFVTPLLMWVLEQGGVICAATYDENFNVIHIIEEGDCQETKEKLNNIRGSKYVQSRLDDSFSRIKGLLTRGRQVAFVGTPCQVAGLRSFLEKDYDGLICVDLVCHGTPSPKLWEKYVAYQEKKYSSRISEISFRNKTYGYHSGTMRIRFVDGKEYYGSARVDYMLKSFFAEIASRPICYHCPFKQLERNSDFTIYDCWHAAELVKGLADDDKGFTNVIVQSEKGIRILDEIANKYEIYPVDTEEAVRLDGSMVLKSAVPHRLRVQFYENIEDIDLPKLIKRFVPVRAKDLLIERVKIIVYRLGLFNGIKRIFKRKKIE